MRALLILALLGSAVASVEENAKNRPVTKVVNLLKDMGKQLEKEAEEDEDVYDKVMCWCETNDRDKTRAIAEGEQKITDLGSSIGELTAASARLTAEISTVTGEVAKNTAALDKATEIRRKDLADFNAEEKDTIVSITGLKNAILVLSKHNSFLQSTTGSEELTQVALTLESTLRKHKDSLSPKQRQAITAFVQSPDAYVQQPASAGSYAPQSGAIFGILKNMKESFESGLADSQAEEMSSLKTYEALKAAKEDEIASGQEQAQMKTGQLAEADEKAAADKQALEDATNTLKADRDFLAMLKSHCANTDAQMEERQKTRALEIQAVSKATAILTSDEAHELFTKTFNPAAFVQTETNVNDVRKELVAKHLKEAAKKLGNPKLALLATKVSLAAFTKVIEDVQGNIDDIQAAKEEEQKLKDYCIEEKDVNKHEEAVNDKDKAFQVSKIADLTSTIEQLESDVEALTGEVAQMQLEMKKAGDDRAAENAEFQQTVSDQRATQQILTSALNVLKEFYGGAAFVQKSKKQPLGGPAPPPGFKTYENNSASGGVMGMIEGIISDAKALEDEATRGEESAQAAYEDFVADTNAAIDAANTEITNKNEAKGKAEGDRAETQVALDNTMATLQNLSNQWADLGSQCDFTLANFDVRQAQKDSEMEALKGAIQILKGGSQGR